MSSDNVLVSICCITYNHVGYIRQCLDGFMMQKTDFAFEVLIHDDASTDGTTEIIKEYELKFPKVIKPLYETENQWVKGRRGSIVFNYPRAKGKYIAMCEGDDYWTDPHKLQKQVSFLENNPDYCACYTKAHVFNENLSSLENYTIGVDYISFENLLLNNTIPTLTMVYDRAIFARYLAEVNPRSHGWKMGDYPIWLYFAANSKIKFIDDITATYRVTVGSSSRPHNIEARVSFLKSTAEIQRYFAKYSQEEIIPYINCQLDYNILNLYIVNRNLNEAVAYLTSTTNIPFCKKMIYWFKILLVKIIK